MPLNADGQRIILKNKHLMKYSFENDYEFSWAEKVDAEHTGKICEYEMPDVAVIISPPFHVKPEMSDDMKYYHDLCDRRMEENRLFLED